MSLRRLLVASGNAGKLAEFRQLLTDTGLVLVGQNELGISDPPETGASFIENALLKARNAAIHAGGPVLADDSGLLVDALGGAPGLASAYYAGSQGDSTGNIARLLSELSGVGDLARSAHFYCVLVLLAQPDDPTPLIAEGRWHGRILGAPQGTDGFGYDPVFFDPVYGCTAAQMPRELKNRISHRAQALALLRARWTLEHGSSGGLGTPKTS